MNKLDSKNKLNILVVAYHPLGGIRSYIKYVYKDMHQFNFSIISPKTIEHDALVDNASIINANLITTRTNIKGHFLLNIFRVLCANNYDIIHSHGYISACLAYLANIFLGIPHVMTAHGILETKLLTGLKGLINKIVVSHVLKNICAINPVGKDLLEHLYQSIPGLSRSSSIKSVILNGVDVNNFNYYNNAINLRFSLGIDEKDVCFGFFGRFMPEKGFNHIIEAIKLLKIDFDNIKVLAIGSGDYLDSYHKHVIQANLTKNFIFIPFQKDIVPYYSVVNAVIMPSLWEALPLQPMEALSCGTPVIASDCMGLREVLGDTPAIIFKSGDSRSLADAVRKFIFNPNVDGFVKYASKARVRYDVKKTSFQLTNLFHLILKKDH